MAILKRLGFQSFQLAMASFPHKLQFPDSKLQVPTTLPQTAAPEIDIPQKTPPQSHRNCDSLFPYFLGAGGKMLKCRGGITTRPYI